MTTLWRTVFCKHPYLRYFLVRQCDRFNHLTISMQEAIASKPLIPTSLYSHTCDVHVSHLDNISTFIISSHFPELLKVIRETENDDLTGVMQKLISTYGDQEQVASIAVDIARDLVSQFIV